MPISEIPWVEKYKPTKLEDVIGDKEMISKFREFIDKKTVQNLLFCGRPGTGKSTCAKLLAKEITDSGSILYINASQESGVDTIRNKVTSFCSMRAFGGLRVVIFDEFDGMTRQSMETMRNTMEEFIHNSRFILTCNYERNIIEPIKSRCQMFDFKCSDDNTQKLSIIRRCASILKSENVEADNLKQDLIKLTNKFYPDIRRTINALQKHTVSGKFSYKDDLEGTNIDDKLIAYIKDMDIRAIRKEIVGNVEYNDLYRILFNRAGEISEDKKLNIMVTIGEAVRWHAIVLDPEINFVTCLINICNDLG